MPELTDGELLADFARSGSGEAFAALVARYVNLVYSTALRFTGNAHHAEEISQAVFIILSRKAGGLSRRVVLSGWLYQTARLTAANFVKGEIRRHHREQEAYMQSTLNDPDPEAWRQIAPLLDDAMGGLGETDRNAVVLRFFENKTAAEVAAVLKVSEAAAHKRTRRALEKLRKFFSKRGVRSTTAIVAGTISLHSVQAAPAALAKTVTAAAIVKGAAASGSILTLVKGALKVMAWTKAKTAVVVGIGILLATGTTTLTVTEIMRRQINDAAWDVGRIDSRLLATAPHVVRIIPSKFPNQNGWAAIANGSVMGLGASVLDLVENAYAGANSRTILLTTLPQGKYDFIANLPHGSRPALQQEVRKRFHIAARHENIETNILFLQLKTQNAPGLKRTATQNSSSSRSYQGEIDMVNMQFSSLANFVENKFGIPVIDQTGLTGTFDINLKWNVRNDTNHENLKQALAEQLGVELVPGQAPIDMLIVEKAN
jgi:uncharacterized protein (TIGR03435 family)